MQVKSCVMLLDLILNVTGDILRDNSLTKGTVTNFARSCKKYVLYLSVYLARKYFLRTLFLLAPTGDRNIILLQWSSTPCEDLAVCRRKIVPLFLSYFKTLSIGPVPGSKVTISCSTVEHGSVDRASHAKVIKSPSIHRLIFCFKNLSV